MVLKKTLTYLAGLFLAGTLQVQAQQADTTQKPTWSLEQVIRGTRANLTLESRIGSAIDRTIIRTITPLGKLQFVHDTKPKIENNNPPDVGSAILTTPLQGDFELENGLYKVGDWHKKSDLYTWTFLHWKPRNRQFTVGAGRSVQETINEQRYLIGKTELGFFTAQAFLLETKSLTKKEDTVNLITWGAFDVADIFVGVGYVLGKVNGTLGYSHRNFAGQLKLDHGKQANFTEGTLNLQFGNPKYTSRTFRKGLFERTIPVFHQSPIPQFTGEADYTIQLYLMQTQDQTVAQVLGGQRLQNTAIGDIGYAIGLQAKDSDRLVIQPAGAFVIDKDIGKFHFTLEAELVRKQNGYARAFVSYTP